MSLEIHIYGPGFGETIFLRWPNSDGRWCGALVDAYSPNDGVWMAEKLRSLELDSLQFAVVTHPHLDHIGGLGAGLYRQKIRAKRLFYWPGVSSDYWVQFFNVLARQKGGELKGIAKMVDEWFGFCGWHYKECGVSGKDVGGQSGTIYSTTIDGSAFEVIAIGPWLTGMNMLVKNVALSIERLGAIDYEHRHANHVSIALLLKYGQAQVVLGGDMEDINWNELMAQTDRPTFKPSLVKVSHHGSANGRIDAMWPNGGGFIDGRSTSAIAVVTPWRKGGNFLPEEAVLEEIRLAGYTTYVTGHSERRRRRTRHWESHVSVRVESNGEATVFEQKKVRSI